MTIEECTAREARVVEGAGGELGASAGRGKELRFVEKNEEWPPRPRSRCVIMVDK